MKCEQDRRQFLKGAALLGAAATAGGCAGTRLGLERFGAADNDSEYRNL